MSADAIENVVGIKPADQAIPAPGSPEAAGMLPERAKARAVSKPASLVARAVGVAIHPLTLLALMTLLGGMFRFYQLSRPAAWVDEGMTYERIKGTLDHLFETLTNQGFPPLHYLLIWKIKQWHGGMSVGLLRLYPAICGTLMIPAMYFLTRQLLSKRHAVVVALFTACSSWLISYSRDAKMYMPLWLFVTLNAGCFLWWMRRRGFTIWLCWVAAGCAMVGLHALGFVPLLLQPIWLLASRKVHWVQGVWLVAGLAVIAAGPIGYYKSNNDWHGGGIDWVERRNSGYSGAEMTADTAASLLYKYSWIQENPEPKIPAIITRTCVWTLGISGLLLVLGAFPWKRSNVPIWMRVRDSLRRLPVRRVKQWLGARQPMNAPPVLTEELPEIWWRSALFISLWIVLPLYGFYVASILKTTTPSDWWASTVATLRGAPAMVRVDPDPTNVTLRHQVAFWLSSAYHFNTPAIAFGLVSAVLAGALLLHVWVRRALVVLVLGLPAVLAVYEMHSTSASVDLLGALDHWLERLTSFRMIWIIAPVAVALAFHYSGQNLATRARKLGGLFLAGGIVIGLMGALAALANGPYEQSVWMPRYTGVIWPAAAIGVVTLLLRLPTRPLRVLAINALLGMNLLQAWARVYVPTEPPLDRIAADVDNAGRRSDLLTFVGPPPVGQAGPGFGRIEGVIGAMYLNMLRPRADSPWVEVQTFRSEQRIPRIVGESNGIKRLVVWEASFQPKPETLLERLGPEWSQEKMEVYPVRVHWSWGKLYDYRRHEYVRRAARTGP